MSPRKPYSGVVGYTASSRTGPLLPNGLRGFLVIYDASRPPVWLDLEESRWWVVCEAHGSLLSIDSRRNARTALASGGEEFCDPCRGGEWDGNLAEEIQREAQLLRGDDR